MDKTDTLIRDRDVALLLGCSRATVWRRVADGTLPMPIKIGGLSRWSHVEVRAVVERAKGERDGGRAKAYSEISRGALRVRKLGSRTLVLREDAEDRIAGLPEKRRGDN